MPQTSQSETSRSETSRALADADRIAELERRLASAEAELAEARRQVDDVPKRASESLLIKDDLVRYALEEVNDGWWDWHIKKNFEYMSPNFWKTLGVDPATKRHSPEEWQDLIHPDDLRVAMGNFERHCATHGQHPYQQNVRYRHAEGHWVTVYCQGKVIEWDAQGDAERMVGIHVDITEEIRLSNALQDKNAALEGLNREIDASRKRFHLLWNTSPDMFLSVDPVSFCVLDCNARVQERLGYGKGEFIGRPVMDFYHPESLGSIRAAIDEFQATGRLRNIRVDVVARSGERVPVLLNTNAIRGAGGEVLFSSSSWTDVSDMMRYTEELQRSNSELKDFAYVASHDLKSPLRAINCLAQWVLEDEESQLSNTSREDLQKLRARSRIMHELLDGLLAYARVNDTPSQAEFCDANKLVERIIETLDQPRNLDIQIDTMPQFVTETAPLATVLRNLIDNAIRHGAAIDPQVFVRCEDQGDNYNFLVLDNGPGIPEGQEEKVIGLFRTVKPRGDTGTTGIGLAIVEKILHRQGGQLKLSNRAENSGACASFLWPKHPRNT